MKREDEIANTSRTTMMQMTMTCSVQKVNTTPVIISVMMFAITVITRIASAKVSEKAQLDSPREGMVLAIAMQIMTVPLSLESWSRRPGMAVLRSTGSLTATPKRVRVAELREKYRLGNQNRRRRKPSRRSKPIRAAQRRETEAM